MAQRRRLVAIMFTDIEGYTSLMQRSESEAVKVRKKHREVFSPVTEKFDGQIVQYYGDGTLSIFNSAVSAVRCACELQKQFRQSPGIPVRIGIHIGDIIISEDDIIGDGVNLASRIESMAIAGSVLISSKVLEEIQNQEDLSVKYLGAFHLKNDQQKRDIYAIDHPYLVVPETHEIEGNVVPFQSKIRTREVLADQGIEKKDVFISYAELDDETITQEEAGWISLFDQALRKRVAQLLGYQLGIWRDLRNDPAREILAEFRKLKVMISIISPRYLESEKCLTELKEFYAIATRNGGLRINNKWRIFKVIKTPVPPEYHPSEIEGILGYEFFEVGEDGHFREFNLDKRSPNYYQFLERFEDVAQDLCQVVRSMESGVVSKTPKKKKIISKPKKTIYLAKTTSDLNPIRDNIRRDLEMHGFRVLPEEELPLDQRFRDSVRENLRKCQLVVLLAGDKYGLVPEDEAHSVPTLQYELSIEAGLPCLIWIPDNLQIADVRQEAFLERMKTEAPNHQISEILNTELEDFKTHLMDTLNNLETETQTETDLVQDDKDRPPRVYLIYDKNDTEAASTIDDHLYNLGFEVLKPLFDGNEEELREMHKDNLRTCDAALIYYGQGSEFWLNAKINDLRKAPGFGRSRPMARKTVFIGGEKSPVKERFRSREVEVIKQFDSFSSDYLKSFTENLR